MKQIIKVEKVVNKVPFSELSIGDTFRPLDDESNIIYIYVNMKKDNGVY